MPILNLTNRLAKATFYGTFFERCFLATWARDARNGIFHQFIFTKVSTVPIYPLLRVKIICISPIGNMYVPQLAGNWYFRCLLATWAKKPASCVSEILSKISNPQLRVPQPSGIFLPPPSNLGVFGDIPTPNKYWGSLYMLQNQK